jgi:hypothetical protein
MGTVGRSRSVRHCQTYTRADAGRGGVELPLFGADQQRAAFAPGAARRTDPGGCVESAGTASLSKSQAQRRGQTDPDGHHNYRPLTRRRRLGIAHEVSVPRRNSRQANVRRLSPLRPYLDLGKVGARPGRKTLVCTKSWPWFDASF